MTYRRKAITSIHFESFKRTLPSLKGRVIAITGTTSGTGFVTAQTVAELGAQVVLLNRPSSRVDESFSRLQKACPQTKFDNIICDLQSFSSVKGAAHTIRKLYPQGIHVLVNNAGVMALADEATEDGFDVQMQTNHLSHFLLTKELFSVLEKGAETYNEARIVNHSSIARMSPEKNLSAKYLEKRGGQLGGNGASMLFGGARWRRYNQTKLANAAFTAALHHRLQAKNSKIKALVAHPGLASTDLQVNATKQGGMGHWFTKLFMSLAQSPEDGAMGLLSCICQPHAQSGQFYGPGSSVIAMKGKANPFPLESYYDNDYTRNLLWSKSEEAIGQSFNL